MRAALKQLIYNVKIMIMGISAILRIILALLVVTCPPLSSSHGQPLAKSRNIPGDDANVARGAGSLGKTEPNSEQVPALQNIIVYHSPFEEVEIKGLQLTYKRHTYQNESPVSGNPVGMQTTTRVVAVTREEVEKLLAFIQTSKFYDLQDTYGAPDGHRYYPYEIHVTGKDYVKNVTYRSNPEFPAPKEFHMVEKRILAFAKESMKGSHD